MAEREQYRLNVQEVIQLSPHLKRVILEGSDLSSFPLGYEGGYVKLLLPRQNQAPGPLNVQTALKRSFTVRSFDREACTLVLDFALHDTRGPALKWAHSTRLGDELVIVGPGPVKMLDPVADWFLLAGDMTALPAIAVNLERLETHARGHAVIEVLAEKDRLHLLAPENVEIHWIVTPSSRASKLAEMVRTLPWSDGQVSAWAACEFSSMKQLRKYLKEERQIPPEWLYLSSYWKLGSTDEEHKLAKAAEATA